MNRLTKASSILPVGRRFESSAQHDVHEGAGTVYKVPNVWPNKFWRLWQDDSAQAAEQDLETLEHFKMDFITTALHKNVEVLFPGNTRRKVNYVLEQPDVRPFKEVTYEDLADHSIRQMLMDMLEKSLGIFEEKNRGVDLLGGQTILDGAKILAPTFIMPKVRSKVCNVLKVGMPVAGAHGSYEKGTPLLCDTRLFNFDDAENSKMVELLKFTTHVQYGVLFKLLEYSGERTLLHFPREIMNWATAIASRADRKFQ